MKKIIKTFIKNKLFKVFPKKENTIKNYGNTIKPQDSVEEADDSKVDNEKITYDDTGKKTTTEQNDYGMVENNFKGEYKKTDTVIECSDSIKKDDDDFKSNQTDFDEVEKKSDDGFKSSESNTKFIGSTEQIPVQQIPNKNNRTKRLMELIGQAIEEWAKEFHMENLPKDIIFDQAFDALSFIKQASISNKKNNY